MISNTDVMIQPIMILSRAQEYLKRIIMFRQNVNMIQRTDDTSRNAFTIVTREVIQSADPQQEKLVYLIHCITPVQATSLLLSY